MKFFKYILLSLSLIFSFQIKSIAKASSLDSEMTDYFDDYFDSTFFKKWGGTDLDSLINIPRPSALPAPAVPVPASS